MIGNHDIDFTGPDHAALRGAYYRAYGPAYYSFAYGPAHFIVVDNIRWMGEHTTSSYRTGLGEEQFAFIRNELARIPEDRLIVFMAHIPWVGSTSWADEQEREAFLALLAERIHRWARELSKPGSVQGELSSEWGPVNEEEEVRSDRASNPCADLPE